MQRNSKFEETCLLDDFANAQQASNGNQWQYVSDTVMGGLSHGAAEHRSVRGRSALLLSGSVSLENNGGFIQAALDLGSDGVTLSAGDAQGVAVSVCGDGESYAVNLRTHDTQRPWQSYRCFVDSHEEWTTHYLPFKAFVAHRVDQPLDSLRLRRIGLIAIGKAGPVQIAISRIALYRLRSE